MKAIKKYNKLNTKLRVSETYTELDEEVKKYEESKMK